MHKKSRNKLNATDLNKFVLSTIIWDWKCNLLSENLEGKEERLDRICKLAPWLKERTSILNSKWLSGNDDDGVNGDRGGVQEQILRLIQVVVVKGLIYQPLRWWS